MTGYTLKQTLLFCVKTIFMLRRFNYVEPSHLWSSLQRALDESTATINLPQSATVESIMETWASQSGYPVVYVERNYETGSLTISQVGDTFGIWENLYMSSVVSSLVFC